MMPMDPQVKDFLDRLNEANLPPIQDQTVAEARSQMDISTRFLGPLPSVRQVIDRTIPSPGGELRVRIITPASSAIMGDGLRPIVVYFHGGGWVLGNLASHEGICRSLANEANMIVISVDYRLAPEHRFPDAVEDAHAAVCWAGANAAEFGGDATRIAVAGDSAGGNLAAAASLMCRDRGEPRPNPAFQVLIYPIIDHVFETGSYLNCAQGFFLSRAEMSWYWDQYVPNVEDRDHPYASPCRAVDLSGLPAALIITAEYDVLRDEAEAFARQLAAAGVSVTLSRYEGMIHGFVRRYPFFDQGKAAIAEIAQELGKVLGG